LFYHLFGRFWRRCASFVDFFLLLFVFSSLNRLCSLILIKFGAQQSMVGWAVAVNSFGAFLASPLFGLWAGCSFPYFFDPALFD